MPSDTAREWVCVWACLKMWASLRSYADMMISDGGVSKSTGQDCYGTWVTCWNTPSNQRVNKDLTANRGRWICSDGGLSHPWHAAIFHLWFRDGVMERQNLAPWLEHARDDTDMLHDADGLVIAFRSPYCPCANSSTARQAQTPKECDVTVSHWKVAAGFTTT